MAENITNQILNDIIRPKKEKAIKHVQDVIPLVDIVDGMYIINHEGKQKFIRVVEIGATNFTTKENAVQNSIISTFAGWLRLSPENCQLKIVSQPRETIEFVERLKERSAMCEDEMKKKLFAANISHIEYQMQINTPKTRYFLIFEYEPAKKDEGKEFTTKHIAAYLNGIVTQARDYFAEMGNSVIIHDDENVFLAEFLYKLLNRKSSKNQSVLKRAERVLKDAAKIMDLKKISYEYPDTKYVNILAPMGISTKTHSDCIIADETYIAYYYITSNGYPLTVPSGWLTGIFSGLPGVDMDIFYRKLDKKNFMSALGQIRKLTRIKGTNRSDESKDAEDIRTAYASQQYLLDSLRDRNNPQDPYNVVTLFTVSGDSYEQLKERCSLLEETAKVSMIEISDMKRFEIEGFRLTLPFNQLSSKIYSKSKRNLATGDLAGFYPFTAYELNDPDGLFIGMNMDNRTLCTLDVHNTNKYPNANITVLGGSGTGKTFTMALLAERNVLLDNQVYVITSEKPHEFKRICDALGGKFLRYGAANDQYMNRYDILPKSNVRNELYGEDEEDSWLIEKLKSLSGWYELLFTDLTEEELVVLDRATKDAYYSRGITEKNDSIYEGDDPQSGKLKAMPIISDVIKALEKINEDEKTRVPQRLFSLLYNFTNGTYAGFDAHTNVTLDKDFLVFDISHVPERIEAATVQSALDFIWDRVKEDPTQPKTIIIEEGWKYLSRGASEAAARQIQEIFKVIRGYGGSVMLATQEINDILASEYGKSVIACSSIKILLGVQEGESDALAESFHLQPGEAKRLEGYSKGACLLLAGKDHVNVQISASDFERDLITTNSRELEEAQKRVRSKA